MNKQTRKVAGSMQDANDLNAVTHRYVETDVMAEGEVPLPGTELRASCPERGTLCITISLRLEITKQLASCIDVVASDVVPDVAQITLGGRCTKDTSHINSPARLSAARDRDGWFLQY